ncbi:MAG TPA: hypothetical protein VN849_02460 [Stellaceae bacterium]|nr:hypothetical protein [Stellaceae bacterium]
MEQPLGLHVDEKGGRLGSFPPAETGGNDVFGSLFIRRAASQSPAVDEFIKREVEAAHGRGLNARLLVPLTRGHGNGAALQFEVELTELDQLDQFRSRGVGSAEETGNWMHAFSEVLAAPPCVEILRFEGAKAG